MKNTDARKPSSGSTIDEVRERQKTIRFIVSAVLFAFIASIGIFAVFRGGDASGGKRRVDINIKEGKLSFSVDKPIVEQAQQPTRSYDTAEGVVEFTTGKIDSSVVDRIVDSHHAPTDPTRFIGKNFINQAAGFLLTVDHPESWQISHDPSGMFAPSTPVNTIYTQVGSHLNVNIENVMSGTDLQTFVTQSLQQMIFLGVLYQMPQISYDHASQTAFLSYVNPSTGGQTYQKVVLKEGKAYIASANYNPRISDPQRVNDLIRMVATFTVID